VEKLENGSYSVDGVARVDELGEMIGLRVPEEGFPTLGGRVFEQLQRRPRAGDEAHVGNFHARVLEVDGMRICRVLLTRLELGAEEEREPEEAESAERDVNEVTG
jgi:CBS domain containing-hemolysin-like protein